MANGGRPRCPIEGCDGDLYREFVTGLNRSTAQTLRIAGLALIIAPIVFTGPFLAEAILRGPFGFGAVAVIVLIVVAAGAGFMMLRHRSARLALRSEQQRCNKCGTVFPAKAGA